MAAGRGGFAGTDAGATEKARRRVTWASDVGEADLGVLGPYRRGAPETLSTTRHRRMRLRLADGDSCFLPLGQLDRSSCSSARRHRYATEVLRDSLPNLPPAGPQQDSG